MKWYLATKYNKVIQV